MLSLFAGAGGFDLAADQLGWQIVGQSEIYKPGIQVLSHWWPDVPQLGDITQIKGTDLDPIDIIVGGFPCQDLSMAGNRKGLAGARSGLFWEMVRLMAETHPKWIIAENVVGLLSADDRTAMGTVVGALAECGYVGAWRVLDAQYFGVPQHRPRVFIVARHLDAVGPHPAKILLDETTSTTSTRQGQSQKESRLEPIISRSSEQNAQIILTQFKSWTSQQATLKPTTKSNCLLTTAKDGVMIDYPDGDVIVRQYTPEEREKLMGWPEGHTEPAGSYTARSHLTGNGVATPVAHWIMSRIDATQNGI